LAVRPPISVQSVLHRERQKADDKPYSEIVPAIPYELHPIPELDRPIFVMAFKGLFDMGEAATGAVDWLSMTHGGNAAAAIDPETLFDFQEVRPQVRLGVNGAREILWPSNNVVWAKTPDGSRDLVLLATAALLAKLEQVCGVPTDHAGLADDIRDWEARVHRALNDDGDVKAYVDDLENKADNESEMIYDAGDMADEIESFLRNRSDES